MSLNAYQKDAMLLGVYRDHMPSNLDRMAYTTLGLVGEAGELLEKVAGYIYLDTSSDISDYDGMIKEFGDVLWYAAACSAEAGWTMDKCLEHSSNPIAAYIADSQSLAHAAMQTSAEAGKYADMVKKFMRGERSGVWNSFVDKSNARDDMAKQIGVVLHCLMTAATTAGITMDEIIQTNLEKLNARKAQGTLFSTQNGERP